MVLLAERSILLFQDEDVFRTWVDHAVALDARRKGRVVALVQDLEGLERHTATVLRKEFVL